MRNLLDKLDPRKRFSKHFPAFPSFWNVKKYRFKTPYFSKGRIEKGKQKSYNCLIVCKFQPISALLLLLYYYKNNKNNENNRYSLTARPQLSCINVFPHTMYRLTCITAGIELLYILLYHQQRDHHLIELLCILFTTDSDHHIKKLRIFLFLPAVSTCIVPSSSIFFSSYQPYQYCTEQLRILLFLPLAQLY